MRSNCVPTAPRRPSPTPVAEPIAYDTDLDEARAVAAAVAAEIARRHPARADRGAVPGERAGRAARGGARRRRGQHPPHRRDAVLRPATSSSRPCSNCAAWRAPTRRPQAPLFQSVSDVLRAHRLDAAGARRRRRGARALGGADRPGRARRSGADRDDARRRSSTELQERQAAQHEPTVSAVVLSTLHSAKGLEWEQRAPRRDSARGCCRSATRAGSPRSTRNAGCSTSASRGHGDGCALSWSRQGLRGQNREPSRFLAELRTSSAGAAAPSHALTVPPSSATRQPRASGRSGPSRAGRRIRRVANAATDAHRQLRQCAGAGRPQSWVAIAGQAGSASVRASCTQ